MTKVSVSVRCTREEYTRYCANRAHTPWLPTVFSVLCLVGGVVLEATETKHISGLVPCLIFLGILGIVVGSPLCLTFWHRSEAARRYDSADSLRQAVTLIMTEDSVTVRTACHEGTLPLTLLTDTAETGEAIGLIFGRELEICIPKRALSTEELTFIKQVIHTVKKEKSL